MSGKKQGRFGERERDKIGDWGLEIGGGKGWMNNLLIQIIFFMDE